MEELKILEKKYEDRLDEIRNKENKTLNEKIEYEEIQEKLRKVHDVMIYITRELK